MYAATITEALEDTAVATGMFSVALCQHKFYLTLATHIPLYHMHTQIGLEAR